MKMLEKGEKGRRHRPKRRRRDTPPVPDTDRPRQEVSATIRLGGGSRRSMSRSNGASILVMMASMKLSMSAARTSSDGTTLGIVASRMLSGVTSDPMKPTTPP
ncbi:hypothetical protein ACFXTN_005741 [Malus domestica]